MEILEFDEWKQIKSEAFSLCPSSPCSTIPSHVRLSSRVVMETNYLYKLSPCPHLTLSACLTLSVSTLLHIIYTLSTIYSGHKLNSVYKCSKWRLRASPFWLLTSDLLHHSSYSQQQQSLVCVRSGCLPAHSKMQQQTHSSSLFP